MVILGGALVGTAVLTPSVLDAERNLDAASAFCVKRANADLEAQAISATDRKLRENERLRKLGSELAQTKRALRKRRSLRPEAVRRLVGEKKSISDQLAAVQYEEIATNAYFKDATVLQVPTGPPPSTLEGVLANFGC